MPRAPLIAIVDDEESVRRALQRLIRAAGFAVETYPSGVEFLQSMQSREPACVVLDLHMPQVNGFEVQDELARIGKPVPVIIITGYDTPEGRARAMSNGGKAYLRKPVDDMMLLAAINEAIGGESD
jgi:FixJ family two-component response regulator